MRSGVKDRVYVKFWQRFVLSGWTAFNLPTSYHLQGIIVHARPDIPRTDKVLDVVDSLFFKQIILIETLKLVKIGHSLRCCDRQHASAVSYSRIINDG